jgi:hypothetical protein
MYFRKEICKVDRLLRSGGPSDASFAAVTVGFAPSPTFRAVAKT